MKEGESVILQTHRLDLIAATFDLVCAELESPGHLGSLLSAQVDPGWPPGQYDRDAQEFFRDRLAAGGMTGCRMVRLVRRAQRGIRRALPSWWAQADISDRRTHRERWRSDFPFCPRGGAWGTRRRWPGALVANAFADTRVEKVIAHASPQNEPSIRALTKSGLCRVCRDAESGHDRFEAVKV